eukprot:tig00000246_g21511.t1
MIGTGAGIAGQRLAAEEVAFSLLTVVTERGRRRSPLSAYFWPLVDFVLDYLQLLNLTIKAGVGWDPRVVSWIEFVGDLFSTSMFGSVDGQVWALIVFWTVLALHLAQAALTLLVLFTFRSPSFRVSSVKALKRIAKLLATAIYIFWLRLFLAQAACHGRACPSVAQYASPSAVPYAVLSLLFLILGVPYALTIAGLLSDTSPLSNALDAKPRALYNIMYTAARTVLVFLSVLLPANLGAQKAVLALSAAGLCVYVVASQPFYLPWVNHMRAYALSTVLLFVASNAILERSFAPGSESAASLATSIVLILLCFVGGLAASYASRERFQRLCRRCEREALSMLSPPTPNSRTAASYPSFSVGPAQAEKMLFLLESEVEVCTRRLRARMDEESLAMAELLYQRGCQQFADSPYVHLCYASFLLSYRPGRAQARPPPNPRTPRAGSDPRRGAARRAPPAQAAAGRIKNATAREPPIDLRFWIFQMRRQVASGGAAQDSMSFVRSLELVQVAEQARSAANQALAHIKIFWRFLARKCSKHSRYAGGAGEALSERDLQALATRLQQIRQSSREAQESFEAALAKFPDQPELYRSYAVFLRDVANRPAIANAFFAYADELEDSPSVAAEEGRLGASPRAPALSHAGPPRPSGLPPPESHHGSPHPLAETEPGTGPGRVESTSSPEGGEAILILQEHRRRRLAVLKRNEDADSKSSARRNLRIGVRLALLVLCLLVAARLVVVARLGDALSVSTARMRVLGRQPLLSLEALHGARSAALLEAAGRPPGEWRAAAAAARTAAGEFLANHIALVYGEQKPGSAPAVGFEGSMPSAIPATSDPVLQELALQPTVPSMLLLRRLQGAGPAPEGSVSGDGYVWSLSAASLLESGLSFAGHVAGLSFGTGAAPGLDADFRAAFDNGALSAPTGLSHLLDAHHGSVAGVSGGCLFALEALSYLMALNLLFLALFVFSPAIRYVQAQRRGIGALVASIPSSAIATVASFYVAKPYIGESSEGDGGSEEEEGPAPGPAADPDESGAEAGAPPLSKDAPDAPADGGERAATAHADSAGEASGAGRGAPPARGPHLSAGGPATAAAAGRSPSFAVKPSANASASTVGLGSLGSTLAADASGRGVGVLETPRRRSSVLGPTATRPGRGRQGTVSFSRNTSFKRGRRGVGTLAAAMGIVPGLPILSSAADADEADAIEEALAPRTHRAHPSQGHVSRAGRRPPRRTGRPAPLQRRRGGGGGGQGAHGPGHLPRSKSRVAGMGIASVADEAEAQAAALAGAAGAGAGRSAFGPRRAIALPGTPERVPLVALTSPSRRTHSIAWGGGSALGSAPPPAPEPAAAPSSGAGGPGAASKAPADKLTHFMRRYIAALVIIGAVLLASYLAASSVTGETLGVLSLLRAASLRASTAAELRLLSRELFLPDGYLLQPEEKAARLDSLLRNLTRLHSEIVRGPAAVNAFGYPGDPSLPASQGGALAQCLARELEGGAGCAPLFDGTEEGVQAGVAWALQHGRRLLDAVAGTRRRRRRPAARPAAYPNASSRAYAPYLAAYPPVRPASRASARPRSAPPRDGAAGRAAAAEAGGGGPIDGARFEALLHSLDVAAGALYRRGLDRARFLPIAEALFFVFSVCFGAGTWAAVFRPMSRQLDLESHQIDQITAMLPPEIVAMTPALGKLLARRGTAAPESRNPRAAPGADEQRSRPVRAYRTLSRSMSVDA